MPNHGMATPPGRIVHCSLSLIFLLRFKLPLGYTPPSNFTASNGTTVTFYFPVYELSHYNLFEMLMHAKCRSSELHSATQGPFDDPCVYLNDTDGAGFDSRAQSGDQFTIQMITNDQERRQTFCHFFLLWSNNFTQQLSIFSARYRATVISEWLG